MSEWKVTYRGVVYPWHCDHMGHMNVMWYAGKFDEACWQLLAMLGLQRSRFARDGTGTAAVEQHIQYKREPHAGDAVTIQSALLEVKDKSVRMLHKMVHDASGEVAATTAVGGGYYRRDHCGRRRWPDLPEPRLLDREGRPHGANQFSSRVREVKAVARDRSGMTSSIPEIAYLLLCIP